ncbi:N-acetylmuramic acid 6-phosphate etherase [Paramicrobacterium chengjingii]|uniref:N-acetylmuramic acid 6-phosphate etherase n=1 Tax=Paramicrobacterium chengjingii TaxID=2769067 RepID=A0ABX6YJN0_9MICO|nr:N-acetylmuramic acid 6-phosphate etherase [Microbacterium chengjingii]QPZ39014.1 N-acetylmuramic acid 6-phosphate etherase [Microbacterium chengjingii]
MPGEESDHASSIHREISGLATERVNDSYSSLDELSTPELVRAMNREDASVAAAVAHAETAIVAAVDGIAERMRRGGRLLYVGAGTPGRLGVLDASEIPPTFGMSPDRVLGVIAGGDGAIRTAVEGAEDDAALGVSDMAARGVTALDSVVGISASGRTPYVLGAIGEARTRGAFTVGFACNAESPLGAAADVALEVVVGPEIVSGSTRLKSGTAQKMVLNMLSTLTMVKLGKTFGTLMVDVQITNEKLRARAERTIMRATACDRQAAAELLDAADGSVKVAIVAALAGIPAEAARSALERSDGFIRHALADEGS